MKTPLILLTTMFFISFFDGVFAWGLPDGFYALVGLVMMSCIGWMWYVLIKKS